MKRRRQSSFPKVNPLQFYNRLGGIDLTRREIGLRTI